MRSAEKSFEFDAAHRLMDYEGLCSNLHGHRYTAVVACSTVTGELDCQDMTADFSLLKKIVGRWIDEHWDHAVILNSEDILVEVLRNEARLPEFRVYTIEGNPTAEKMAEELFIWIEPSLRDHGLDVDLVKIYETPTSVATFSR